MNALRTLVFCAGLLSGCDFPGQPPAAGRAEHGQSTLDFNTLYAQNCAGCHGAEGRLGPAPPLNDPLFLAIFPEQEVASILEHGRPGTLMPAFARQGGGTLTNDQVQALSAGLATHFGPALRRTPDMPRYAASEGLAAAASADRGQQVFAAACAGCHGEEGRGLPGVAGDIRNQDFLALASDQALRRLIITGRADLGMPDFASEEGRPSDFQPLNEQALADLTALLASWRDDSAAP